MDIVNDPINAVKELLGTNEERTRANAPPTLEEENHWLHERLERAEKKIAGLQARVKQQDADIAALCEAIDLGESLEIGREQPFPTSEVDGVGSGGYIEWEIGGEFRLTVAALEAWLRNCEQRVPENIRDLKQTHDLWPILRFFSDYEE